MVDWVWWGAAVETITVNLVSIRSLIILSASASASACVQCRRSMYVIPSAMLGVFRFSCTSIHIIGPPSIFLAAVSHAYGQASKGEAESEGTEQRGNARMTERDRYLLFRCAKSVVDRTCFSDACGCCQPSRIPLSAGFRFRARQARQCQARASVALADLAPQLGPWSPWCVLELIPVGIPQQSMQTAPCNWSQPPRFPH